MTKYGPKYKIKADISERLTMETKLKKRNRQLSALSEISNSITTPLSFRNLNALFENITGTIVEVINAPLCTVRMLGSNGMLHCRSVSGVLKGCVTPDPIDYRKDIMGKAVSEARIVVLEKIDEQYISDYNRDIMNNDLVQHAVFIPLFLKGKPVGVLTICSSGTFEDDYMPMLSSIANIMTFAIEKADLYNEVKQHYLKTIKALVTSMEVKDVYTQGHSVRVSHMATMIGRELGLPEEEVEEIEIAGILHDIGKIGISDRILTKPGYLEPEEFEIIKQHPEIGRRILEQAGFTDNIINGTLLHHKRYDLQGYPAGGETGALPLVARIIGVADAYDAMISDRSYKSPMTKDEAIVELHRYSGTQFCPEIVKVVQQLHEKKLL